MKSIRAVISTFLGASLLFSSSAVFFFGSPPQQVEAQQAIVVSATVPATLDLTVSTNTVSFGSIIPNTSLDKPDAFTLTVRTNTPTWNVTAKTENANLIAGSSTIQVQDNLKFSWQSGPWSSLSAIPTELFSHAQIPTIPNTHPISLSLKVPVNTNPGDYSVTLLVHLQ